jgi:hypothetical protein
VCTKLEDYVAWLKAKHPSIKQANKSSLTKPQDYVAWLKAKHPSIKQAFLPYIGKNLVLYKTSSD